MYLENKVGEKFEFKGTQKFKRQYEKENQREYTKAILSKMSKEEMADFENGELDIRNTLITKYLPEIDIEEIQNKVNEKYIKLLLCYTNNVAEEVADGLVEELYEEYGEEQVNQRFSEILNEVFTQVGKADYKPMPTWN